VPGHPRVGDYVSARPPAAASALAAARGLLPQGLALVKTKAAGAGDRVCAQGPRLVIEGRIELRDGDPVARERKFGRVVEAGYGARRRAAAESRRGGSLDEDDARRAKRHDDLVQRVAVSGVLSVVVAILAMPLMSAAGPAGHDLLHRWMAPVDSFGRTLAPWLYRLPADGLRWASFLLTLPIVLWSGREIYRAAWNGARHRNADMNRLISVGAGAACLQSLAATVGSGWYERGGLAPGVHWEAVV